MRFTMGNKAAIFKMLFKFSILYFFLCVLLCFQVFVVILKNESKKAS